MSRALFSGKAGLPQNSKGHTSTTMHAAVNVALMMVFMLRLPPVFTMHWLVRINGDAPPLHSGAHYRAGERRSV
jgi:hypothetical protein